MIEDFKSAIESALDESGQIHYILVDDGYSIRHISHSFVNLCGKKYFDLIHSQVNHLPLFVFQNEGEFISVAELDFFKRTFSASADSDSGHYYHFRNGSGETYTLTLLKKTILIQNVQFHLFLFIDQSINEQLRERSIIQRRMFEDSNEAIVITDPSPKILSVNRAFTQITGYEPEEAIGKNPSLLNSGYHSKAFFEKLWSRLLSEDRWSGKLVNRKKMGEIYSERSTIRAIRKNNGEICNFIAIFSEVSESDNKNETAKQSIKHDDLTGLPRKNIFEDRLEQSIGYAKRHKLTVAVLHINLDRFNMINTQFDTKVGDAVIRLVAKRINNHIRDVDTLARTGGDEYILMLRDLSSDFNIDDFGSRLLKVISDSKLPNIPNLSITASIGVTAFPDDESSASTLMRHAAHAMDIAKTEGRNCIVFYSTEKEKQKQLARAAKVAILDALEDDQMVLHVQPQFNLATQKVYGIEFLIRWLTEDGDLVYPDQFLNSQKDKELLTRVDRWVIDRAITLLEGELSEVVAQNIKVGINLTPCSLQDADFHQWLKSRFSTVSPSILNLIEIEILENDALENINALKALIDELTPFGVQFSLDDFGTGYSSLSIFNQLSVKTIKIDRSFVRDMVEDLKNLSMVKAICEMSRIFEREIIAEGVEYREQADLLSQAGCHIIQGYGIAHPMETSELPAWLKEGKFSKDW
jgi:diguanylate cyclase (GGDEF)-like protein/PAS domain S-box-containing protein